MHKPLWFSIISIFDVNTQSNMLLSGIDFLRCKRHAATKQRARRSLKNIVNVTSCIHITLSFCRFDEHRHAAHKRKYKLMKIVHTKYLIFSVCFLFLLCFVFFSFAAKRKPAAVGCCEQAVNKRAKKKLKSNRNSSRKRNVSHILIKIIQLFWYIKDGGKINNENRNKLLLDYADCRDRKSYHPKTRVNRRQKMNKK